MKNKTIVKNTKFKSSLKYFLMSSNKFKTYILVFSVVFNSLLLFNAFIPKALAIQTFPSSFSKINHIEYSFLQQFSHYDGRARENTGGVFQLDINVTPLDTYNISIKYSISRWTCGTSNTPDQYNPTFVYEVDPYSRKIIQLYQYSEGYGATDLVGHFFYYFIDPNITAGDYVTIFHEDLMVFAGTPFFSSPYFRYEGLKTVSISKVDYEALHIAYNSTIGYDPSIKKYICGLGWNPLMNVTIDLYYEKQSGVLLYSKSTYLQYIPSVSGAESSSDSDSDSVLWQKSIIERTITKLDYIGEPGYSGFNPPAPTGGWQLFDDSFWADPNNRMGVIALVIVFALFITGTILIKKRDTNLKLNALKMIDNAEEMLRQEIEGLKQEIENQYPGNEPNSQDPDPLPAARK